MLGWLWVKGVWSRSAAFHVSLDGGWCCNVVVLAELHSFVTLPLLWECKRGPSDCILCAINGMWRAVRGCNRLEICKENMTQINRALSMASSGLMGIMLASSIFPRQRLRKLNICLVAPSRILLAFRQVVSLGHSRGMLLCQAKMIPSDPEDIPRFLFVLLILEECQKFIPFTSCCTALEGTLKYIFLVSVWVSLPALLHARGRRLVVFPPKVDL